MTAPENAIPLRLVRVGFADACDFVRAHHGTHKTTPPGCKDCFGVADDDGVLHGVIIIGRPIARHFDNGRTLEVTRAATDGTPNANSMLYAQARRYTFAALFDRLITYTQGEETGSSLKGAGYRIVAVRPPNPGWNRPSRPRELRGTENVQRTLWEAA